MPNGNQGGGNSNTAANRPVQSNGTQGSVQPRESAMRETTHVKAATRSAKERNVRTTIDLKRPWYYSA